MRKAAEKVLFDGFASYYANWKAYAKKDPEWAEQNPISLTVLKTNNDFSVSILPKLETFRKQVSDEDSIEMKGRV